MSLAATAGVTSCNDGINFASGSAKGSINPQIELNTDVLSSKKSAARAASSISANDLGLKISATNGSYSGSWNSISDFPAENSFSIGDYLVEATYGSVQTEGFECPAYYGSQTITVLEDQTTPVSITATLANTMLSVEYTEAFKKYMTAWSAEAHSTGGEYIYYTQTETRAAYMRPGTVTLSVEFTKPNGTSAKLQVAQFEAAARHQYNMTIDIDDNGAGDAVLTVIYDDTLNTENINIDLSDELMNAPAPTITGEGVANGSLISHQEGDEIAQAIKTNIMARGSLAAVTLTTQSSDLIANGWPAEIDLLSATAEQQATLKQLGFNQIGLWQNPEKMAVIDFTNVLEHTNNAVFTLQVRDQYSKLSEAFSFSVSVNALQLAIVSVEKFAFSDDEITLNVRYNGSDINALKIRYLNDGNGAFADATIKSVTKTDTENVYKITIASDTNVNSVELYATAGNKQTDHVQVQRAVAPINVSYNDYDIWATKATVRGTIVDASAVSEPKLAYRQKGASGWLGLTTSTSGTALTANISSLRANTTYELAALSGGNIVSEITTFTTEAATQLPNSDMEDWYVASSGSYWSLYYLGTSEDTVWGTNNPMTTSQGSAYAYCRISGTASSTDAHGGTYAAVVRTVGWGSGNTAIGSTSGVCKYIDAGLLHLGSSRSSRPSDHTSTTGSLATDDLSTGMSITSRPTSLSFWYKYTQRNSSDHGVVEVYVYDAAGNIIATGSDSLGAASAYTQSTIALSYSRTNVKAAQIYVKFLSTYSEDYLTKTSANLTAPSFGNLSTGTYMGSQLYLDDLSLNY
jgi:hypothetical protein